jgi:hypothetical protein
MPTRIASLILLFATIAYAQEPAPVRRSVNLLAAISQRKERQDRYTQDIAERLARSHVRTAREAEELALRHVSLNARGLSEVTGLYLLARDVPGFATSNTLFWEVRTSLLGTGVWSVLWVSAETKAVKTIFP